jgi:hypothetical protein
VVGRESNRSGQGVHGVAGLALYEAFAPALTGPFHVIKNLFGYRKVSYRGIAKNAARAKAHAALANLYIARRRLLAQAVSASAVCARAAT